MAYVTIPKDLTKVKSKVMFGLTKRQLICFGAAALIGVPLFFLLKTAVSSSAATLCMIVVMLPFFLLAMYERHGQPLEVIAGQMIQAMFIRPKERPYQTNNFYAAIQRQKRQQIDRRHHEIRLPADLPANQPKYRQRQDIGRRTRCCRHGLTPALTRHIHLHRHTQHPAITHTAAKP